MPDAAAPIPRPRLHARDSFAEASAGVLARPARSALTALGTVLGVAALVSTVGLSSTAGAQILTRLDELAATDVLVRPKEGTASALRWNAAIEAARLNGVRSAGLITPIRELDGHAPVVSSIGVDAVDNVGVMALSSDAFETVRARWSSGRALGDADDRAGLRTAVVGATAAVRLNITDATSDATVFVDGEPFTVVGILSSTKRRPELVSSVIVSNGAARAEFGLAAPGSVQIETTLGANELIRDQAPLLLSPNQPDLLVASSPPLPRSVRASVSSDVRALLLVLGSVSLVVGAIGIANVTLVSVLERTGEIGVRRALGAMRRHVAAQFVAESTILGFVGGTLGTALGLVIVVSVSLAKGWSPVLQAGVTVAGPVIGAAVGLLSGLYPAWRASTVEPAEALRSSV